MEKAFRCQKCGNQAFVVLEKSGIRCKCGKEYSIIEIFKFWNIFNCDENEEENMK